MNRTPTQRLLFWIAMILIVVILSLSTHITLFEDGSWRADEFLHNISGCLPWAACN